MSGPMPEYTTPTLSVSPLILRTVDSSISVDGSFFSVASTTPLVALMPREIAPACTAFSAYSICISLPLGLKVVSEKEYCISSANEREVACEHLRLLCKGKGVEAGLCLRMGSASRHPAMQAAEAS